MRMEKKLVPLLLAMVVAVSACTPSAWRIDERSLLALLEESLGTKIAVGLFLDAVQFRRDGSPTELVAGSLGKYPVYRAFSDQGLIILNQERDLSAGFSGWNDWLKLTQAGVQRTAWVTLTVEGSKRGQSMPFLDTGRYVAYFDIIQYRLGDVLSNELHEINGEAYRVVVGIHSLEWIGVGTVPSIREALIKDGYAGYLDGRHRVLIKYDPIASRWRLLRSDRGPKELDFQTDNVPTALSELRQFGSTR
jgi:hypothetical protein